MRKRKIKHINYDKVINKRVVIILIITLVLFFIVVSKLVSVMVINKDKYNQELNKLTYSRVLGTSSPRGRIYDRNYNIIVDNKSLKTITYQKIKGTSNLEMVEVAQKAIRYLNLDYDKLTKRAKKEYYYVINKKYCDSLVTQEEKDKVWIYEENALPILYLDDSLNRSITIHSSKYSWNNYSNELCK